MKTVLITGATGDLGKELCRIYAKHNYNLLLIARNEEKIFSLVNELSIWKNRIQYFIVDLKDVNAVEKIYSWVQQERVVVDILINVAGFGLYGDFLDRSLSDTKELLQINIASLVELCFYFGKDMIRNKTGKIINFSSISAYFPGPFMASYYASKAFVLSFSVALAKEVRPYGVFVSAVVPGVIPTEFYDKAGADTSRSFLLNRMPLGSSKKLAYHVYKKSSKNKLIIKEGILNQILILFSCILPLRIKALIVSRVQRKKAPK
ncbi:MAG: SDR family NAD(P)-dependent oxidoreductase, partial [Anaeroplasmataceae bacterium]|nr:SDR family NAD(P)-dependent oxidoreductase [Anaeroplasmataceae bacterium]